LTTKFTQHTAAFTSITTHCHPERSRIFRQTGNPAKSRDLGWLLILLSHNTPINLMGLYPALPMQDPRPHLELET